MKKVTILLAIVTAMASLLLLYHIFKQETIVVGKYSVLYYINRSDLNPESFPRDLESLKNIPGLIRITWQEQVASDMIQEYCYLPGKGVEESRRIHTKQ